MTQRDAARMTAETGVRLDEAAFAQLRAHGRPRTYRAGAAIFLTGDPAAGVFGVVSGTVLLVGAGHDGQRVVLDRVGPGGAFGELAAIDGRPRSADALAESDCETVYVEPVQFNRLLADSPTLTTEILRAVATRLRATTDVRIEHEPEGRVAKVARAIVDVTRRRGEIVGTLCVVDATPHELADRAGLDDEAASTALAQMASVGWLRVTPGRLEVLNLPAVAREAGDVTPR